MRSRGPHPKIIHRQLRWIIIFATIVINLMFMTRENPLRFYYGEFEDYYTTSEVAIICRIPESEVKIWAKSYCIPITKKGIFQVISFDDFDRLMKMSERPVRADAFEV